MVAPFEIIEQDGARHGSNGEVCATLLDSDGRMFRRRAVKGLGGPNPQPVEWLVIELNGARVYIDGQNVVVTRQDLMP